MNCISLKLKKQALSIEDDMFHLAHDRLQPNSIKSGSNRTLQSFYPTAVCILYEGF